MNATAQTFQIRQHLRRAGVDTIVGPPLNIGIITNEGGEEPAERVKHGVATGWVGVDSAKLISILIIRILIIKAATPMSSRSPVMDPAHSPIALGRRFYQIAVARTAEVHEPLGLRPLEFGVIVRLHDAPGLDQNSLAELMALDRTSAGAMVQHLEQLGLVERAVNDSDRRARVLRLTPAGRTLHDQQRPKAIATQMRMLEVLSPAERQALIDMLVRVVEANEAYVRPGAGRRRRGARPPAGPTSTHRK